MPSFSSAVGGHRDADDPNGNAVESLLAQLRLQRPSNSDSLSAIAGPGTGAADIGLDTDVDADTDADADAGADADLSGPAEAGAPPGPIQPRLMAYLDPRGQSSTLTFLPQSFPPAAPTPPVRAGGHTYQPSTLANAMRSSFALPSAHSSDNQTAHLLSLLRLNGQAGSTATTHEPSPLSFLSSHMPRHDLGIIHAPAPNGADPTGLLAALMNGAVHSELASASPAAAATAATAATAAAATLHTFPVAAVSGPGPAAASSSGPAAASMLAMTSSPPTSTWNAVSPSVDTQQYLLGLLNRPEPSQGDVLALAPAPPSMLSETVNSMVPTTQQPVVPSRSEFDFEPVNFDSPTIRFGSTPHSQHSQPSQHSQHSQHSHASHHSASHLNPFGDLAAAGSSGNQTPKSSTPGAPSVLQAVAAPIHQPNTLSPAAASSTWHHPDQDQRLQQPHKRPLSDRGTQASPEHTRRKTEHGHSPSRLVGTLSVSPVSQTDASADASAVSPVGLLGADGQAAGAAGSATVKPTSVPYRPYSGTYSTAGTEDQVHEDVAAALNRVERQLAEVGMANRLEDFIAEVDPGISSSAPVAAGPNHTDIAKQDRNGTRESTLESRKPEAAYSSAQESSSQKPRDRRPGDEDAASANLDPVADSWESAEVEETIIVESSPAPVKVYNLPMKPWISITMRESKEAPAVFRDEAIIDIARLKKEFDQVDRNLVAASEIYMTYGMSKAGGLRVIRQANGKDAKLFTDTKDRIFTVAIASSREGQDGSEAILGTGVSGTVYWARLKKGPRDYVEDAHPEECGFALPPALAYEGGDTPGGLLKTRARTSSEHPEYFAVGRGKSINIIWPSYILANKLFKTGHDRVVDTEALLKQCSLKINTGKAGKDFVFSPDDTVVVSLDKAGRVKFWDVSGLTAKQAGGDPHDPMPKHMSLEINQPLVTLTTTPEGEKAWPTSVLLLDKFRPYQKRTALRYMMVGMRQNHTLQLWDLALGKAVQEFNFPHNKESDAVCSVAYHAPSSIIVVGHPTRNSIYLLHLSAPKCTIRNLKQVEYMQRLAARDASIPTPEATAVISGIREYSFANKGILRSLSLLGVASGEDEPILFELYAMHSKGVTCLSIRQGELGWSRDNKVIDSADAVAAGVVDIAALVSPVQPPQQPPSVVAEPPHRLAPSAPATPAHAAEATPQLRIATRGSAVDGAEHVVGQLNGQSSQDDEKKGSSEPTAAMKMEERKDEGENGPTPLVHVPEKSDKSDRKSRKKKAAAAAAAAALPSERELASSHVNGAPSPSRAASASTSAPTPNKASGVKTPRTGANDNSATNFNFSLGQLAAASQTHLDNALSSMESRIVSNVAARSKTDLDKLFRRVEDVQVGQSQAASRNQAALLEVVSNVLSSNVEQVLGKILDQALADHLGPALVPAVHSVVPAVHSAVNENVSEQFASHTSILLDGVQKEIQRRVPQAMAQALQEPDLTKAMTERISHDIDFQIAKTADALLPNLAHTIARSVQQHINSQRDEPLGRLTAQLQDQWRQQADKDRQVAQLVAQNADLSNLISNLVASQAQMKKSLVSMSTMVRELQTGLQTQQAQLAQQGTPLFRDTTVVSDRQSNAALPPSALGHSHSQGSGGGSGSRNVSVFGGSPHMKAPGGASQDSYPQPSFTAQQHGQFGFSNPYHQSPQQQQQQQQQQQKEEEDQRLRQQQQDQLQQQQEELMMGNHEDRSKMMEVDRVVEVISGQMQAGDYSNAILRWLQSGYFEEVFQRLISTYHPDIVVGLAALLQLSLATMVSENLNIDKPKLSVKARLLESSLYQLETTAQGLAQQDSHFRQLTPNVMQRIKRDIEQLLLTVSRRAPHDPFLKDLSRMIAMAARISGIVEDQGQGQGQGQGQIDVQPQGGMAAPAHVGHSY